jgi:soluble lytic murein transglycosylase-like protein
VRRVGEISQGLCTFVTFAAAGLVFWAATPAAADVFYYKDADGVFHFTNVQRPGSMPFIIDQAPLAQLRADEADARVPDTDNYDEIISRLAKRFRVERALVKAVIRAESGFNRLAVSSAGARGLMQLMPDTARHHGVRNIYDAEQNIEGGVRHLRLLIDRHGNNIPLVLAAYNAGSAHIDRYRRIPPIAETQDYVARVLRFRQQYLKRERMASLARNS